MAWSTSSLREATCSFSSLETTAIVRAIVQPYVVDGQARMEMSGEAVVLPPQAALALTMILHELVSNATTYGAFSTPGGRIVIRWEIVASEARTIELEWRETGLSGLRPPKRRGFGAKLIEASARRELNGEVSVDFTPGGVRYSFKFPAPDFEITP